MEKKDIDDIAEELKKEAQNKEPDEEFDYRGYHVELVYDGEGLPGFRVDGNVVPPSILVDKHPIDLMDKDIGFWKDKLKDHLE